MSRFFIDRPVFAWVIAILLMVGGAVSIKSLPVAQYPSIAPPTIAITATYPGASAKVLEDTVTQVIEQKLNGIDHLRYIQSASLSSGQVTITVTFEVGTDPDIAQVQVQNKVAQAAALLPAEVQLQGLVVDKAVQNFLLVIGFVSEDGSLSGTDLCDFAVGTIQDPISRLPGVGDILAFGTQYAMRIWLDPGKLYQYQFTTGDVTAAIAAQNVQISAGQLGANPAVRGQLLNASIMAQSLLKTPAEFRKIVLRVNPDGSRVLLGDVARVELGSENYDTNARFCGKPAAGMAIKPATGANALQYGRCGQREDRRDVARLSARHPGRLSLRHHALCAPVDRGSDQNARGGGRAGVSGDVPLSAELAGHDHSDDRRAGGASGHVRRDERGRLFHQYAHAVRTCAGHRFAGRRCHRGRRECRARDGRGRAFAESSHAQIDGSDLRRAGRHRPGSLCGFCPWPFLPAPRSDLPAICRDHGRGGGALGAGGLDPHAGPLRHLAQAGGRGRPRRQRGFFGWFNRGFDRTAGHMRPPWARCCGGSSGRC